MLELECFADALREIRMQKGLSIVKLSELTGISQQCLGGYEKGAMPQKRHINEILRKLAVALEQEAGYFDRFAPPQEEQ